MVPGQRQQRGSHQQPPALRFIYLGTAAGTQETQHGSLTQHQKPLILLGNIKLLCHVRIWDWKVESPPFSCFKPLCLTLVMAVLPALHFLFSLSDKIGLQHLLHKPPCLKVMEEISFGRNIFACLCILSCRTKFLRIFSLFFDGWNQRPT